MNPEVVAAAFITFVACCVASYVLLIRQARRYEIQLEALRNSVWREASGRREAEARVRELSGEDQWVQDEMTRIEAFYADTAHDPMTGKNAARRGRG